MDNTVTTINYFQRYKWITIPSILLLLVGIFFFVWLLVQKTQQYPLKNINRNAVEAAGHTTSSATGKTLVNFSGSEYTIDPNNLQGLVSKSNLPDGQIKYILKATDQTKSDFIIAKGTTFVFRSTVYTTDFQPALESFISLYGTPDKIVNGSKTYGAGTQKYIYATLGFTLFVNPQSKLVVQQHIFPPTSVDEYITKYGNEDQ